MRIGRLRDGRKTTVPPLDGAAGGRCGMTEEKQETLNTIEADKLIEPVFHPSSM